MRLSLVFLFLFLSTDVCLAQFQKSTTNQDTSSGYRYNREEIKKMKGYLRNSGDQKKARNILILKEVADYKIGDERLAEDFASLERNREFHEKMQKIMENLSNKRMRNSKNREVIDILNDAGNRIYNLLSN